ncbi:hypothetical protein [Kitasatospora viridis]|uniref:Uncharacterized protein n=1 Tax=Kitasatospora viridis TaxID=281105 RepID=A0A561UDE1_9ACTN|nr:hypothetical protein [Kitasatospora viridis]TWF97366.1 hypothetical protein FHX73_111146 [Kitasatospora viridis]
MAKGLTPSPPTTSTPRAPDRAFPTQPARWTALLILLAGYLAVLGTVFPVRTSHADLVADLRSHRASVVRVDTDGAQVFAQWTTTGAFVQKAETYRFPYDRPGPSGAIGEFEQVVARQLAGSGAVVRFQPFDPSYGFGGLSLLVAVLYPSVLGWSPLGVGTYLVGLVIVAHLVLGDDRRRTGGAGTWLWICLLTGFGFFAYLWVEPSPLLAFPARRRRAGRVRPPGVPGALGATAAAFALLAAGGIAYVRAVQAASH